MLIVCVGWLFGWLLSLLLRGLVGWSLIYRGRVALGIGTAVVRGCLGVVGDVVE